MYTNLNKDEKQDLVVVAQGNNAATLSWYLNANNTLPTVASGSAGTNAQNQAPFWGICRDVNNDTFPDCLVSDLNTNTVRVFLNDGKGVLPAPVAGGAIPVGAEPRELNLDDVNGDGQLDLLVANRANSNFSVRPRGPGCACPCKIPAWPSPERRDTLLRQERCKNT